MRETNGFAQNLVLHRLLAERALLFANLALQLTQLGRANDRIVRFDGFPTALGHATPPMEKLTWCSFIEPFNSHLLRKLLDPNPFRAVFEAKRAG